MRTIRGLLKPKRVWRSEPQGLEARAGRQGAKGFEDRGRMQLTLVGDVSGCTLERGHAGVGSWIEPAEPPELEAVVEQTA